MSNPLPHYTIIKPTRDLFRREYFIILTFKAMDSLVYYNITDLDFGFYSSRSIDFSILYPGLPLHYLFPTIFGMIHPINYPTISSVEIVLPMCLCIGIYLATRYNEILGWIDFFNFLLLYQPLTVCPVGWSSGMGEAHRLTFRNLKRTKPNGSYCTH